LTGEVEWGAAGFARLAVQAFGCEPDAVEEFSATVARLSAASAEERHAALETPFGDWLEANVPNASVRRALGNMVKSLYSEFPERVSLGRLMDMLVGFEQRSPDAGGSGLANDEEVGGMGGISAPFARALESHGGRIILDHEPSLVTFEGTRATGLVALSANHFVLRVRAKQTIVAYPIWDALEMLPPERIDPGLAEISERLQDHVAIAMGWVVALKQMPRVRGVGYVEDYDGWNRLLIGPERTFSGGFHFPSLGSQRLAPDGKHLLHLFIMRWVRRGEQRPWGELEAALARAKAHLRKFYLDLDECTEWDADQYVRRPAMTGWYWAPVERHPVRVAGCEDLFIASATVESDTGPADISAHAGLLAAQAILEA
jgi:phytoene dehydrogenase-like protein